MDKKQRITNLAVILTINRSQIRFSEDGLVKARGPSWNICVQLLRVYLLL